MKGCVFMMCKAIMNDGTILEFSVKGMSNKGIKRKIQYLARLANTTVRSYQIIKVE